MMTQEVTIYQGQRVRIKGWGEPCAYCRRAMFGVGNDALRPTRDHYIPVSRGGSNAKENIRIACAQCNGLKGNLMPDAWDWFMANNPRWWETHEGNLRFPKVQLLTGELVPALRGNGPPRAKKAPKAALRTMTAAENARRIAAYMGRSTAKEDERTAKWGTRKKGALPWMPEGEVRPLGKNEPAPIRFSDPDAQAAYEAYARKYWYLLRVPIEEATPPR